MEEGLLKLDSRLSPVYISEEKLTKANQNLNNHAHEHELQFFYFLSGAACIHLKKKGYQVRPSDILLINTNEFHYKEVTSAEALHHFVIRIDLNLLNAPPFASGLAVYLEPLFQNSVRFENRIHNRLIENLLCEMIDEARCRQTGYELKLISICYGLIAELFRHHVLRSYSPRDAELLTAKTRRFEEVIGYIERNYLTPIPLEMAASIAHMSKGYFCRLFKDTTGHTLSEYINLYRIEKAALLLSKGDRNVTETALAVGFEDVNYFCRLFKKYMNLSPAAYGRLKQG